MRIFNKRERIIAYGIIGLICLWAVSNLFLTPVMNKNDRLDREIQFTVSKLNRYKWLLNNKERLQKKYGGRVSGALYAVVPGVSVLSELENMAKDCGISIVDIRPQGAFKDTEPSKGASIDLRAEGSIQDFVKFIYAIENSLSLFNIDKFQLKSKPNSSSLEGSFSIYQTRI